MKATLDGRISMVADTPLPVTEHLSELRRRIVLFLITLLGTAVFSWNFREGILEALLKPALEALGTDKTLQAIAPTEIFFTYLKCALLSGFVLSLPMFFWQLWAFISPGLYPNEKRAVIPFVLIATLLFAAGSTFGHQLVFPLVYGFFANFSSDLVNPAWTMREVFALTTRLFVAFGVGFELPVFVFLSIVGGLATPRGLLAGLKYGVLAAFTLGAILTPPDVISEILLAAPLTVLYLVGILAGHLVTRKKDIDNS